MKKKLGPIQQSSAQLPLDLSNSEGEKHSFSVPSSPDKGNAQSVPAVATPVIETQQEIATVTTLATVRTERVRDILIRDLIRTRVPAKQA